ILAAVLLPQFLGFTTEARKSSVVSGAKDMLTAIQTIYSLDGEAGITEAAITKIIPTYTATAVTAAAADNGKCNVTVTGTYVNATTGLVSFTYKQVVDGTIYTVVVTNNVVGNAS
ncbi:MAG: hypothetical protein K0S55_363, partial [Clostridia bacterium]|nr:hypothetical protein [Clostridia bacterium]